MDCARYITFFKPVAEKRLLRHGAYTHAEWAISMRVLLSTELATQIGGEDEMGQTLSRAV
jgi:hypothetical protein